MTMKSRPVPTPLSAHAVDGVDRHRLPAAAPAAHAQVAAAEREAAGEGLRLSWSAFGTLGYAQSNRAYRYFGIDDDGTARRDTVLGAQLDAQRHRSGRRRCRPSSPHRRNTRAHGT